jgi:hypothetical protein
VRGAAAKGQFLEYDPHQGWGPLCEFLGKPVPEEPFPSGNVAQEFHGRIGRIMKTRFVRAMRNFALASLIALGAAYGGYAAWGTWEE